MKKILSMLLMLTLMISMVACTNQASQTATQTESQTESSDWEYIKSKGEMVMGITLFQPMNYMENNELTGFETEFAKAVCEKLGVKAKFQEINWDSKEIELNSKNIDCIWNGMTITEDRKQNMSISVPYMGNRQVMIVKKENAEKFKNNVDGANIVAEAGSTGESLVQEDEFFKNANYVGVDSQAKGLMDVASGTSDIVLVDYVLATGSIGEGTDYEDLVMIDNNFDPQEYGIAFRKGSDTTEKVNSVIQELVEDGTLKKIAEKYKLEDLLLLK